MNEMSIQQVARLTGTTSRTLRHYDQIGLLRPSRTGSNGYRRYGSAELVRLQRILLLRELGLGLTQIAEILESEEDDESRALRTHLTWLNTERDRIGRQIAAVEQTVARIERGEDPMDESMFDGFDHTQYKEEVTERWGSDAYQQGDAWWRGLSDDDRAGFQRETRELGDAWARAAEAGTDPTSPEARELAERHVAWLRGIPGTPAQDPARVAAYVRGLGDMYVADPRFGRNYGGAEGAGFVRDALYAWADRSA
ncbi:MerR family transcriptional regulator [Microbacterium karelineae]|uniref:MerR family transcriptional regulator n=1 Tax=Microbacterium karelineae TaxID=2654283 RepID=UPI0012EAF6DA|nr:MerR family transcriptional regulator [Microbacterium karelineae]